MDKPRDRTAQRDRRIASIVIGLAAGALYALVLAVTALAVEWALWGLS